MLLHTWLVFHLVEEGLLFIEDIKELKFSNFRLSAYATSKSLYFPSISYVGM